VWESNLLFIDTSSAYEEAFGLSWKDLASFGTLIAALTNTTLPFSSSVSRSVHGKKEYVNFTAKRVSRT
jgi:hypothetical protein